MKKVLDKLVCLIPFVYFMNICSIWVIRGALGINNRDNSAFGMLMCGSKGYQDLAYKLYFNPTDEILDLLNIEFAIV